MIFFVGLGRGDIELYDNQTVSNGLEYIRQIIEDFNLPKDINLQKIGIETSCRYEKRVDINLCQVRTIIDNQIVHHDMTHILSDDKLNTKDYFKLSNTTQVMLRPGLLSKYIRPFVVIRKVDRFSIFNYIWKRNNNSKSLSNKQIESVTVYYDTDFVAFINDWKNAGYPLYFGITEDEYNQIKKKDHD